MSSPFFNCYLTAITGPASVGDYMQPTGPGSSLWTGRAPAYLKRARRGAQDQGMERKGATDTLFVLDASLAPVLEAAGSDDQATSVTVEDHRIATTVTVEDHRVATTVTRTFTVMGVEHRAAGTSVDSVRLDLDRETT